MTGAATQVPEVYVVSDGTGDTAGAAVTASMVQFQVEWRLRTFSGIRHESEVRRVVGQAAQNGALLVFTLVDKRIAGVLVEQAIEHGVPVVDLLGPLIARAADHLRAEPRAEPGLLRSFSDDYFRRIEAVEFAVRHDDGANLHTLFRADLVLTGASRTSKTPLSMYMAQRGHKTGNVPIVPGVDPPRELLELDPHKVIGLSIDASVLLTVRQARVRVLGASPYGSYASSEAVVEEVSRTRRLFREHGWRVVDISGRAVEENAARILQFLDSPKRRGLDSP